MEVSKRLDLENKKPKISYEEIVAKWQARKSKTVFTGHFLYSFVTETNQIEDINVSYNTTRELFESEQLVGYNGDFRSVMSVLNNKNVAAYMERQLRDRAAMSISMVLETHRLLMFASMDRHRYEDNGERAGEFKKKDYCVGRYDTGSIPEDVPEDIKTLCELVEENKDADSLKLAAVFQCMFESVHPFADGNGRVGRWLTNYLLVLSNHPPVLFAREDRQQYYDALEAYDRAEEYLPMYEYLKQQTLRSWSALRELI